jgi:hypothetical protein
MRGVGARLQGVRAGSAAANAGYLPSRAELASLVLQPCFPAIDRAAFRVDSNSTKYRTSERVTVALDGGTAELARVVDHSSGYSSNVTASPTDVLPFRGVR